MEQSRVLPEHIRERVQAMPESSYGATRVTVVLDDGTRVPDVFVAWGTEVVKVGASTDVPFDVARVVDVVFQPSVERHERHFAERDGSREIVIYTGSNQDLLARLHASGARYIVIGSTAAWFHVPEWPQPRDLDIVIDPTEETARKVAEAVNAIEGVPVVADPKMLARPNTGFPMKRTLNVDVLTPIPGFDFSEHWALAKEVPMAYTSHGGVMVRIASLATLIAWKRLALPREPARATEIAREIERLEDAARDQRSG